MSDQTQAFGGAATATTTDQPTADQQPSPVNAFDFIGEGKQYATPDLALSAIPHKDAHISKIEAENAALRSQLEKAETIDSVLEELRKPAQQKIEEPSNPTPAQPQTQPDVSNVVRNILQEEQAKTIAAQNIQQTSDVLQQQYGDKVGDVVAKKATEIGMTVQQMQELAATSPNAVLALFGDQAQPQAPASSTYSQANPQQQMQTVSAQINQKDFSAMVAKDKSKFLSRDVQLAQMKAALENPDTFFSN